MSDLATFRIDTDHVEPEFSTLRRTIPEFISDGVLVPDDTLQAIADAVKAYKEFDYEPYLEGEENPDPDPAHILNALLDELLDALTEGDKVCEQEHDDAMCHYTEENNDDT